MVTKCYNNVNNIFIIFYFFEGILIGLKQIRKLKNLNQQKVALDLNISREALSFYENGKREPCLSLLVQMSNYFNVSINYLITGNEFKKK